MTNKDAIKNLKLIQKQFNKYDFTEAINHAIRAIEFGEKRSIDFGCFSREETEKLYKAGYAIGSSEGMT